MAEIISPEPPHETAHMNVAFVVEERANPSSAFFVLPAITACGYRAVRCGFSDLPSPAQMKGAAVVFVRYVPPAWAKLVEAVRPNLRALVFFMDDDVLDTNASVGMPWRYRFKLARMAAWRREWLQRQNAELWVSSNYLKQKYSDWHPKLALPTYISETADVRRVFYHGTASHEAEISWLRPVLEEALRLDERLVLEIIGGRDVYRLFRDIPRVTVTHPMRWSAYQAFLSSPVLHIGLAPLLDLPFNRGRSYTKFFDITRCGAVGIFSPGSIYSEVVEHEVSGLVVALDQEAWIKSILRLARDESFRLKLLHNAEAKSIELSNLAQRSYPDLMTLHQDS